MFIALFIPKMPDKPEVIEHYGMHVLPLNLKRGTTEG